MFKTMKRLALTSCAVLLAASVASATQGWSDCTEQWVEENWYPAEVGGSVRICRDHIAISFDTKMIVPAFSAYWIDHDRAANLLSGRDDFYEDPDLKAMGITQAAVKCDAFNDTWNRGHLAPSHIMSFTEDSKKSTYTMANVAPQAAKFNQLSWNTLETAIVDYIVNSGNALHIVTGVMYDNRNKARRSFDNVAVPDYYFKVLCDRVNGQSVGFYGRNENVNSDECHQLRPVTEIETIYGGSLLPSGTCQTSQVNATHWWKF